MIYFQSLVYFAQHYLQIYSISDCIEIMFCSFIVVSVASWLAKDHTKPLLLYFYAYFTTLFIAYFFQLPTIYQLTLLVTPIYFILLIIHHQKNLQKNFIIAKNKAITPLTAGHNKEWLEVLLRSLLIASHHNKNITCVIEQSDTLDSLIEKPFSLNIPIQKNIIAILLESKSYDTNKLLVINQQGNITGMNSIWSDLIIQELLFHQIHELRLEQEYAKVATLKTDAIVLHVNSLHQLNFVGYQGKIIENISIDQALKLIQKLLYKKNSENLLQGSGYDTSKAASFSAFHKD